MTDDSLAIARDYCKNLSPRKTARERSRAAKSLLSLLESQDSSIRPVDVILCDAIPALLHAAQAPKRTAENLQPDPSVTPSDVIDMADAALLLLGHLCTTGVRTLQEAGWHIDDDGTGRGRPVYIHPASGVSQETPPEDPALWVGNELAEDQRWALNLLFELSVLTTPYANPLDGTLLWPARIRYHDPGTDSKLAITVVDVAQDDDDEEEQDGDKGVQHLASTRHLVLGPWHGITGFRETEVDLDAPPGFHLESWYTCALSVAGFLSTKVPGRGRVLILGLGGGAMPAFFNLHWPGIAVETVESDPMVAKIAERWFGLSCEPPLSSTSIPGFELADDEPTMFVPSHIKSESSSARLSEPVEYPTPSRSTVIRVAQASTFAASAATDPDVRYDAILVDVYTRGAFPVPLLTPEFFTSLAGLLKETPTACVAVNAGVGGDRDAVERLMRGCPLVGEVGVLMDGTKGTLEGEYENAVVVGLRKSEKEKSQASFLGHVSPLEWSKRVEAVAEGWPDSVPSPFRLKSAARRVALEGEDDSGEIMLMWDGAADLTGEGEGEAEAGANTESENGKKKMDLKDVQLADRDDPAFELFD
ncbi:hypothetical protein HDU67_007277 [Dinochytrium kinnereticum]|nr:hypothetical protein HDU67_007277 [Dinochytrium kinnereticum]